MDTFKLIVYVLIYALIGFGVFQVLTLYDKMFIKKLKEKFKDEADPIIKEYREIWQIKKFPDKLGCLLVLFGFIIAVLVYAAWPILVVGILMFCPGKYLYLCKKYNRKS